MMAAGLMGVVVTGKERFVQKRDERSVPKGSHARKSQNLK
jgi:hypothetical protein